MSHYLLKGSCIHIFIVPLRVNMFFVLQRLKVFLVNIRINVQFSPFAVLSTGEYNAAPACTLQDENYGVLENIEKIL